MTEDPTELYDIFEPTYLAPAFERDDSLISAIFGNTSTVQAQSNPLVRYFIDEGTF